MNKVMTATSNISEANRVLTECELDAVGGGFVIYGAEDRGIIIDFAVAFCSNNLREPEFS